MRNDARVAPWGSCAALLLAVGCASAPSRRLSETELPSRPQRIEIAAPAIRLDGGEGGGAATAEPQGRGVRHTLMPGQTLYSIARAYHVSLETLMRVNGIDDPRAIPDGTSLLVPGALRPIDVAATFTPAADRDSAGTRPPASRSPQPRRADTRPASPSSESRSSAPATASMLELPGAGLPRPGSAEPRPAPGIGPGPSAPPSVEVAWPLRGTVTSRFGSRGRHAHHEGVDIGGVTGEEILAAAAGTVVRAGKEAGYGRMVVIDHGRGITTLYAHASRLLVREGDAVRAGDVIAEVGRSGNARGSHLHFEIHRNGRPVDPLPLLKSGSVPAADAD